MLITYNTKFSWMVVRISARTSEREASSRLKGLDPQWVVCSGIMFNAFRVQMSCVHLVFVLLSKENSISLSKKPQM